LASPLPPWRSIVSGGAFEVFPGRPASEIRFRIRASGPPPLDLPFRALVPGWAREPSSRGLGRLVIPTDVGQGVHSRSGFRRSFGQTVPPVRSRSAFAVSHCLDGLLHLGLAGLLRPAAGRMFAAFRRLAALGSLPGPSSRSSQRCSHPSKNSSSTAAPRHRGPCLLAVCSVCRMVLERTGTSSPRFRSSRTLEPRVVRLPATVSWGFGRLAPPVPNPSLPRVPPSRGRPISAVSRGYRMASRGPVADSYDRPGWARWLPRGFHRLLPWSRATLESVKIPTSSLLAVRWRRAHLGRHSRARTARPPLGA